MTTTSTTTTTTTSGVVPSAEAYSASCSFFNPAQRQLLLAGTALTVVPRDANAYKAMRDELSYMAQYLSQMDDGAYNVTAERRGGNVYEVSVRQ